MSSMTDNQATLKSKIRELVENKQIVDILNEDDLNATLSNDGKVRVLQRELLNFEARTKEDQNCMTANERFLLRIAIKLNSYIEYQQAVANNTLLHHPEQFSFAVDPQAQTQLLRQRQAFADAKVARLEQQISEMGLQYQCQVTQIESLQKMNTSLAAQVQSLESKLLEAQSKSIAGYVGKEKTPRQLHLEGKLEARRRNLSTARDGDLPTTAQPSRARQLAGYDTISLRSEEPIPMIFTTQSNEPVRKR